MASVNSNKVVLGIFGLGLLAYLLYIFNQKKKNVKIIEISKQQAPTFITKTNEQKKSKKQPSMIEFEVIDKY
jgi:hypothetical protein